MLTTFTHANFYSRAIDNLTHLSEILKIRKLAKLMSKKWVFFDEDRYMNTTIGDIRQEFNIVIS